MRLSTPTTPAEANLTAPPQDFPLPPALELAEELAARYRIAALSGLLASAQAAARQDEITVAVVGRFKAGKSSFLNHFFGRAILPVGVVPVTAVVTEIRYGAREAAHLRRLDGREEPIGLDQAAGYVSEKENPENIRQAALIRVDLPELRRFRGLKFVDTPGLESALAHNTRASLEWLPNVGLALVAISVDPPLSEREIELVNILYRFTPRVAVLLTKADLLSAAELAEVMGFVRSQLARHVAAPPPIFPYSVKPGFEHFRQALEAELFGGTLERLAAEREAILARKIDTLLRECGDYLALALHSAELADAERQSLRRQLLAEKEIADEVKSAIRLVVRHAAAGSRPAAAQRLEASRGEIERRLTEAFEGEFANWSRSLAVMLSSFEEWLADALRERLAELSAGERGPLLEPLGQVRKQAFHALQQFRDRLSDRTARLYGVPLRTAETEIIVEEPRTPHIRIGRVFDRNWELLSPVLPVWMIQSTVRGHFRRTVSHLLEQNLSRLAAQWEESLNAALRRVEQEAGRRLDELLATVESLVADAGNESVARLREDLARLARMRDALAAEARN